MNPAFLEPDKLKLLLFGGKGGVGKTSCAVATALHWAEASPDQQFLLISTDPAHSLQDSLATMRSPPNLDIRELDAQQSLHNFQQQHAAKLREIAHRGTFLDDDEINHFLSLSLPGLDELMALLEISRLLSEGRYRAIVVDTAPSGHTLRLLLLPDAMRHWLDMLDTLLSKHRYMKEVFHGSYQQDEIDQFVLQLSNEVDTLGKLLTDQQRCRFIPVMLAETLSLYETNDLLKVLRQQNLAIGDIIVNRLVPHNDCAACSMLRHQQLTTLTSPLIDHWENCQLWSVPLYPAEVSGKNSLQTFWQGVSSIDRSLGKAKPPRLPFNVEQPAKLPLNSERLLLFCGKGGVGKTTLACATALQLSTLSPDKKFLLFSSDPAHSLADCLDRPVGREPTRVSAGLDAMEVDAMAEFSNLQSAWGEELSQFFSNLSASLDFTFDRRVMQQMMDFAPPGIDEVIALSRASAFLHEESYELFILDAAPTGHLVRLLELPAVLDDWLKAMFDLLLKYKQVLGVPQFSRRLVKLSRDLKFFRCLLTDPQRSAANLVTIPTHMALEETRDLFDSCQQLGLKVRQLSINLCTTNSDCELCHALHQRENRVIRQYQSDFSSLAQSLIYRASEPRGVKQLKQLGSELYLQQHASDNPQ